MLTNPAIGEGTLEPTEPPPPAPDFFTDTLAEILARHSKREVSNPETAADQFAGYVDTDALFCRITALTAELILHGPSLDDLSWYDLLSGEGE